MQVVLNNIAPVFLEKEKLERSQIWNQQIIIHKGDFIQLVAPSGSGKTSLVHFLYGMRSDYTGTIEIDGQPCSKARPEQLSKWRQQNLSIVFQDLRLFAGHTAFENIKVKQQLQPYHPQCRINEMAATLGIPNKLQQPAGQCSYGEQQRIAIIRALQQPFDILILDEPFSHLDEENSKKAMDLIIAEATARNAAILLADLAPIPYFPAHKTYQL